MSSHYDRGCLRLHTESHPKGSLLQHKHTLTNRVLAVFSLACKWKNTRAEEEGSANRRADSWNPSFSLAWRTNWEELNGGEEGEKSERNGEILPPNCRNVLAFADVFYHQHKKREREDWCVWQRHPLNQTLELQRGETTARKPWIWFWRYLCQFSYLVLHHWGLWALCSNLTLKHFSVQNQKAAIIINTAATALPFSQHRRHHAVLRRGGPDPAAVLCN